MNDQIIAKITKAITHAFKSDGTLPGLTIAWLPHNQSFYVSVVRWVEGEKVVFCSAQNTVLGTALLELAGKFLAAHPPVKTPVEELADMLSQPTQEVTVIKVPLATQGTMFDDLAFPQYDS